MESGMLLVLHKLKTCIRTDYTQLYDFLKYNQKEVDDLRAERLAKTHDPLALMANSNNPFNYPVFHQDQPSSSTYMQQPQPQQQLQTHNTLIQTAIAQPGMNMGQDRQMQMVGGNGGNQFRQYAGQNVGYQNGYNAVQNVGNQVVQDAVQNQGVQNVGNQNGLIVVPGITNQNPNGNGNVVAARAEGNATGNNGNQIRDAAYLQTQLLIAQKEEAGIQLQAEEFDLMAAAADLDEIEEVNANCILMANLQQASTSGTQTDNAPVYDSDGSAEEGGTAEIVNSVNRDMKETNAELTTELARYKNQEKCFEISQEKYDKLERCYQKSVYQEQCLTKKINALHLSSGKQITTLNEEISNLSKQLSKEKSTVSSLLEEKKKLKSDFKIREDELLDKQIQLENKIKELDNILVKTGQSIQTMHMLSPKPDSFYHTEQKMALGYQNPFYLKQAQRKQQSLYNGKVLLEKHDPPVVHDSEETLQLAQDRVDNTAKDRRPQLGALQRSMYDDLYWWIKPVICSKNYSGTVKNLKFFRPPTDVDELETQHTFDVESSSSQYVDHSNANYVFLQTYPQGISMDLKDHPLDQCSETLLDQFWKESMRYDVDMWHRSINGSTDNIKPTHVEMAIQNCMIEENTSSETKAVCCFIDADHPNCLLVKRRQLYGFCLKQAPRAWYDELSIVSPTEITSSKAQLIQRLFIRRFNDDILVVQVIQFPFGGHLYYKPAPNTCYRKSLKNMEWNLVIVGTPMEIIDKHDLIKMVLGTRLSIVDVPQETPSRVLPVGAQFLGKKLVSWSSKKQDCVLRLVYREAELCLYPSAVQGPLAADTVYGYASTSQDYQSNVMSKSDIAISCNPVQTQEQTHPLSATII
ncbi:hypothetical protein Tco_1315613 [Tanacetum coccineum]